MSSEDTTRWRATLTGARFGFPQVELRRDGMVIVLSRKGYKYDKYDSRQPKFLNEMSEHNDDRACVHIVTSGHVSLTLKEFDEFKAALDEASRVLDRVSGNEHIWRVLDAGNHPFLSTWACTLCNKTTVINDIPSLRPDPRGECTPWPLALALGTTHE